MLDRRPRRLSRHASGLASTLAALGVSLCLGAVGCGESSGPKDEEAASHAAALKAAAAASGGQAGACSGRTDVKLSRDVVPIFMSSCSGEFCHGLAMTTPSRAYGFLVRQPSLECDDMRPLVTPGDPGKSYVIDKILARNMCSGHPMPRGLANRLSAAEVASVTDWICEGAPLN